MYSIGAVFISLAVLSLAIAGFSLLWMLITYIADPVKKKFNWGLPSITFIVYIIFITIGLILINI